MNDGHTHPFPARVGIVGLGRMGANMARRLREVGVDLVAVHDVDPARAAELAAELGVAAVASPAEVAERATYVFTVVTDDAAMRAIFFEGAGSLLAHAAGRTFVNCATLSPAIHEEIARAGRERGFAALEACMAGSIAQARGGTLVLITAGESEVDAAARPLLETLGAVRYVGGVGQAAICKALINMLMNVNTAALAEALGLGAALGLDLAVLSDLFARTGANSRVLETDGADMIAREHETYFSAAHAAKDSGIALDLARGKKLDVPLAAATKRRYDELVALGFGESDKSAIAELSFPGRAGTTRA